MSNPQTVNKSQDKPSLVKLSEKVDPYGGRTNRVIPSLVIDNASEAIEWYKKALGATVTHISKYNGQVAHAEITIENTTLMISDEMYGMKSAKTIGDTPVTFYVYTKNVDEVVNKATTSGAKIMYPVEDQFYGDRTGSVIDPYGFKWTIATHIKDVQANEMQQGLEKMMSEVDPNQKGGKRDIYYKKYMKYKMKYLTSLKKIE